MILGLSLTIWSIIKFFVIVFVVIYIIFSLVLIKQVQMMTNTLEIGFEKQLRFISVVHFLFAIGVLIFSILIL